MFSIPRSLAIFTLFLLCLQSTHAQLISSLPQCVQNCIEQSQDENCDVTDVKCLCRASAGNFLPDLVVCIHGNCDNDLDNNLLLTPLQLACQLVGVPIPAAALRNAENEASSLATQATTTATVTVGGSSATSGAGAMTTIDSESVSTVTVTTTQSGNTIYEIYPVTIDSTTTISGPTSTVTLPPSVSVSEITTTATYTTTNSRGSTTTFTTSLVSTTTVSAVSSESIVKGGGNSDTTTTTSVAAQVMTSSSTPSKTSKAPEPGTTDSAPFTNTNSGAVSTRNSRGRWLWMSVLTATWWIWT